MKQDALVQHYEATSLIDWRTPSPRLSERLKALCTTSSPNDAHIKYVNQFDAQRSIDRAECMRRAIRTARENAFSGAELTIKLLQDWQREVVGISDVSFRRGPAFAKGGLEVYGLDETTEDVFAEKLIQDSRDTVHSLSKAIRVYLDICFVHPFENGNARAARLAFDFYLTRGGFAVSDVRPLFALPRVAGRKDDYLDFLQLAVLLCEKTQPDAAHQRPNTQYTGSC